MSLRQIDIVVRVEHMDPFLQPLEEGALSLSWHLIDQDTRVHLQAIFDETQEIAEKIPHLQLIAQLLQDETAEITSQDLPPVNWLETYAQSTPPLKVDRFFIYGSHSKHVAKPVNALPLWIDAATAFGSGEHATTSGCLRALLHLRKSQAFQCVLDMGCGTGILGIAAAKLWPTKEIDFRKIVAGDIDPEAMRVTTLNMNRNQVQLITAVCKGFHHRTIHKHAPYDLIIANILAKPLCRMASDLATHLQPNGYVILSGLLSAQESMVLSAYASQGIFFISRYKIGEWCTLILKKRNIK